MNSMTWPAAFAVVGCAFAFAALWIGVIWGMRESYTITYPPEDKKPQKESK